MKHDTLKKRKYFSFGGLCYYRKVEQKIGFAITVNYYVEHSQKLCVTDTWGNDSFIDADNDNLILVECKEEDYPVFESTK